MGRSWTLSPDPRLEDAERAEHEFIGPFTRVTLTDQRIIFSTLWMGDTSIAYDEVTRVEAGFSAGPVDLRDSSTVVYGIYVARGEGRQRREEWAWIPRPREAARLILDRGQSGQRQA